VTNGTCRSSHNCSSDCNAGYTSSDCSSSHHKNLLFMVPAWRKPTWKILN
jgi:hypothetical protein